MNHCAVIYLTCQGKIARYRNPLKAEENLREHHPQYGKILFLLNSNKENACLFAVYLTTFFLPHNAQQVQDVYKILDEPLPVQQRITLTTKEIREVIISENPQKKTRD